jgi:ketosteroid isomerase-like protein
MKTLIAAAVAATIAMATPIAFAAPTNEELKQQVTETEKAFAATMAKRDFTAFSTFISEEAVFWSGPKPLHGKEAIAAFWKRFYEKPEAPFSWEPDNVEVVASGTLAHSTGPVYDPKGKLFSRFNSVWRQEAPGKWRIVFDKGQEVCNCKREAEQP